MSKRKTITFSIIILIVCLVLYTRPEQVQRGYMSYTVERRIDAGSGRTITILGDTTPFEIPAWYYEIDAGKQLVATTFLSRAACYPYRNFRYKLLTSSDRELVGVVCENRPDVLLVLYDFASGESWPRGHPSDTYEITLARGRRLKDRLQAENPEPKLALSDEVP